MVRGTYNTNMRIYDGKARVEVNFVDKMQFKEDENTYIDGGFGNWGDYWNCDS